MRKTILFILCVVILSSYAAGLGISPAREVVHFTPGQEERYSFTIINSDRADVRLLVSAQGPLQDRVVFSQTLIEMSANEESREVSYTVALPQDLSPGQYVTNIIVVQIPSSDEVGQTTVGATVGVVSQFVVDVSYPGKYASAKLDARNEEDGSVSFFVTVSSLGEFDLPDVNAEIEIYGPRGMEVASVLTAKTDIPSGQRKELVGRWWPEGGKGEYLAKAIVNYGEGIATAEHEFNVGDERLRLAGMEVNDFSLGEIAKFEILAENLWNERIDGAYSEMEIYGVNGNVLASIKSPNYDIDAGAREVMQAFWDTEGVVEGSYEAKILLHYPEGLEEKELTLEVSDDSITIIGFGYHISSLGDDPGSLTKILIGVIVLLVLVNLSWFVYLRKRLKKR